MVAGELARRPGQAGCSISAVSLKEGAMHYFSRPSREAAEGIYLAQNFGKHYEPFGYLALGRDVRLSTHDVELLELEGKCLAIHPESTSWAFLSEAESSIYRTLHGKPF